MANKKSAKKMIGKIEDRTKRNRMIKGRCRTYIKKVKEAIVAGDKGVALLKCYEAERQLQKAVSKGVFHQKTVSRWLSRLSRKIKKDVPGEFVLPKKRNLK